MQIVRVAEMILPSDSKNAVQQLIGGANIKRQVFVISLMSYRICLRSKLSKRSLLLVLVPLEDLLSIPGKEHS